jgi:hypothetical protein
MRLLVAMTLAWSLAAGAQTPGAAERPAFGPGILDPKFPVKPPEAAREPRPTGTADPVLQRYESGDYAGAARLGVDLLKQGPQSHEVRYAVANSLAWTGRYDRAIEQYQGLYGTPYDARARTGVANVLRWRGRADLAEPLYQEVLRSEPANEDARNGLALDARDLRPSLTARITRSADSQDLTRNELGLTYSRWSADRSWRFEVGVQGDRNDSPRRDWSARSLHGSAWATRLPLSPRLDLSVYDSDTTDARLFGTLQVEPIQNRLRVRAGRVNWGRLAFNAAAEGLTARTLGILGETDVGLGVLRGRLDGYDVSDGNRVLDGELQLTPAWQPLPLRLVWFGGVYGRGADREDPRYWSPRPGYGLAFVGLQRGWYSERADITASVRRGFGFTDSARNSWTVGLNGRYWMTNDLAIGLEAWAVESPRPADYRMHQVAAFVQQLW